jgi:oligopeptidase B
MRQVDSPELQDYLAAENEWTAQRTAHTADLRQVIFDELAGVLPDDDVSGSVAGRGVRLPGPAPRGRAISRARPHGCR